MIKGSSWTYAYPPDGILQCRSPSRYVPTTSLRGLKSIEMPVWAGDAFSHSTVNHTSSTITWAGTCLNDRVQNTTYIHFLTTLMQRSISSTCLFAAVQLIMNSETRSCKVLNFPSTKEDKMTKLCFYIDY